MSLRPRYSLLTLLILTALVAGGVKLWRGPHHVVERNNPEREIEYTYTSDWRGNRFIDGPYIERVFQSDQSTFYAIRIQFYQRGTPLLWKYVFSEREEEITKDSSLAALEKFEMTSEEQAACKAVVEQEKRRLVAQGRNFVGRMFVYESKSGLTHVKVYP